MEKCVRELMLIEKLIPDKSLRLAASWDSNYKVLVSAILSSRTKDEITIKVCKDLFRRYPTMKKLSEAKLRDIERIIRPVNYYKTKARNILSAAKSLKCRKIPSDIKELLKLDGVGRKVANVYLAEAHKADAIGVDTHVARISRKMGWTTETKPKKIEEDLIRIFPRKMWGRINPILVRFGRTVGRKRKREDEILEKLKLRAN